MATKFISDRHIPMRLDARPRKKQPRLSRSLRRHGRVTGERKSDQGLGDFLKLLNAYEAIRDDAKKRQGSSCGWSCPAQESRLCRAVLRQSGRSGRGKKSLSDEALTGSYRLARSRRPIGAPHAQAAHVGEVHGRAGVAGGYAFAILQAHYE
jgi:hypothetical protein